MKRILSIILVFVFALSSLLSCGQTEEPIESNSEANGGEGTDTDQTQSSTPAPDTINCNHNVVKTVKGIAPTCIKTGLTDGKKCATCGKTLEKRQIIPTISHMYVNNYCKMCEKEYVPTLEELINGNEKVDTKQIILKDWEGKTLNVLATNWYGANGTANGWSEPDLTVNGYDNDGTSVWGTTINNAILQRKEFIKEAYGVEVKFIASYKEAIMSNQLVEANKPEAIEKYHIAMPRVFEAQQLVQNKVVYDLSNSNFIDFSKSYYNQIAHEAFTVAGHTFFAAGDFSFLDELTSYVIYYNMAISDNIASFPDLYQTVKEGKWTISEMVKWAATVSDDNGANAGIWEDDDTYGFGATSLTHFFQTSGIRQVGVNNSSTNPSDYQYKLSLNEDPSLVEQLVSQLSTLLDDESNWSRTNWTGNYVAMQESFTNGKLLFYNEIIKNINKLPAQSESFKFGILPMPKLNESESYYTPCSNQSTVMCIPKCTPDRNMSEYFFDVLSHTGQDYVMKAYYSDLQTRVYQGTEEGRTPNDSIEIIKNYILNNIMYDLGYINNTLTVVQYDTIADISNADAFSCSYIEYMGYALEMVLKWNDWYDAYKE